MWKEPVKAGFSRLFGHSELPFIASQMAALSSFALVVRQWLLSTAATDVFTLKTYEEFLRFHQELISDLVPNPK